MIFTITLHQVLPLYCQESARGLLISRLLHAGRKALDKGDNRIALWHADIALRATSPAVEAAQMLKVKALSALNRHSEALSESRSLTVEGNPSHPDVLATRAGTLYSAGNMQLAERVYQEVKPLIAHAAVLQLPMTIDSLRSTIVSRKYKAT